MLSTGSEARCTEALVAKLTEYSWAKVCICGSFAQGTLFGIVSKGNQMEPLLGVPQKKTSPYDDMMIAGGLLFRFPFKSTQEQHKHETRPYCRTRTRIGTRFESPLRD